MACKGNIHKVTFIILTDSLLQCWSKQFHMLLQPLFRNLNVSFLLHRTYQVLVYFKENKTYNNFVEIPIQNKNIKYYPTQSPYFGLGWLD